MHVTFCSNLILNRYICLSVIEASASLIDRRNHCTPDLRIIVHGPHHFSVPNIRTKLECYQLIILHKMFSNLYDNLSK